MPYLRNECGVREVILVRTFHVTALPESVIGERIADLMERTNPSVGTSAKQGRCELRVRAAAPTPDAAEALMHDIEQELNQRLGRFLLGAEPLEHLVARLLHERGLNLVLYEGHMAAPIYHALGSTPQGLACLQQVIVQRDLLAHDTASATAIAGQQAEGLRTQARADLALAMQPVTPQSSSTDADAYTQVCLALVTPTSSHTLNRHYDLNLAEGWQYVGSMGLEMIRRYLSNEDPVAQTSSDSALSGSADN